MAQTLLGNVKGPKGDTGAQGPQGEQGPTGAQGPQGETGPANTAFITDAFSTSQAYNAGDYCIYNNTLYRFAEDKAAGEWDDSKVMSTLIGTELSGLNSSMGKKLPVVNVDNTTADNYREDGRAIYGHIREGRGRAFGIEYQYTASGKTYGAQLIISYADGVLFRQLVEDVWSEEGVKISVSMGKNLL